MVDVSNVAGGKNASQPAWMDTGGGDDVRMPTDKNAEEVRRKMEEAAAAERAKAAQRSQEIADTLDEIAKNIEIQPPKNGNVLNRIIKLLIELTPILQHLGKAQADLLSLPTQMQGVYTDLISKAPYYPYSTGHDKQEEWEKDRESKNQKVGNATESLRSFRDVWSNYAKQLQSGLNTIDEAVKQQTDMLTTFLQQLRELCSLITK